MKVVVDVDDLRARRETVVRDDKDPGILANDFANTTDEAVH